MIDNESELRSRREAMFLCWYAITDNGFGLPILWTGPAGGSKTAVNLAFGRQYGGSAFHASPGNLGEGFFGCTPYPSTLADGTAVFTFPPPEPIAELAARKRGLIFFDEFRSTPAALLPAMLSATNERMLGTLKIPPTVRVWGASNSVADAVNGRPLAAPISNRFVHLNFVDPSPTELANYIISTADTLPWEEAVVSEKKFAEIEAREREIEEELVKSRRHHLPRVAMAVSRFLNSVADASTKESSTGSRLRDAVKSGTPAADGAFATPRSWSNAIIAITSWACLRELAQRRPDIAPIKTLESRITDCDGLVKVLQGTVGRHAEALVTWWDQNDIPDVREWFAGRVVLDAELKSSYDRMYLFMGAAARYVITRNNGAYEPMCRTDIDAAELFFAQVLETREALAAEVVSEAFREVMEKRKDVSITCKSGPKVAKLVVSDNKEARDMLNRKHG